MVSFVVALSRNNAIGKSGTLPWHLPADLQHFKRITEGHTIVMGRKTFESLPKILPNRHHIVLTTQEDYTVSDDRVTVVHSLEALLDVMKGSDEYYVIGGATLFNQLLPQADIIYLTLLEQEIEGDTFFPILDYKEWYVRSETRGTVDEKNPIPHTFFKLARF